MNRKIILMVILVCLMGFITNYLTNYLMGGTNLPQNVKSIKGKHSATGGKTEEITEATGSCQLKPNTPKGYEQCCKTMLTEATCDGLEMTCDWVPRTSYDCRIPALPGDNKGTCTDPTTGLGKFKTKEACEAGASCKAKPFQTCAAGGFTCPEGYKPAATTTPCTSYPCNTTDCCTMKTSYDCRIPALLPGDKGTCTDPKTGLGKFKTKEACEAGDSCKAIPFQTCDAGGFTCLEGYKPAATTTPCTSYPCNTTDCCITRLTDDNIKLAVNEFKKESPDFKSPKAVKKYGPISGWDVSGVTNMTELFSDCDQFNENISTWDVRKVTKMQEMFYGCTSFNQPIGDWKVGSVTKMYAMFVNCTDFNQPIGNWDVSIVTNMNNMFFGCTDFDQDISDWNVSSVTNMSVMFYECHAFDQPIGSWDVSIVTKMSEMFKGCTEFNQDISDWDVSNVTTMQEMFKGCTEFNQDISDWKNRISDNTDVRDMFDNTIMSDNFKPRGE